MVHIKIHLCHALYISFNLLNSLIHDYLGISCWLVCGTLVHLLPINSSAGLNLHHGRGVERYSSRLSANLKIVSIMDCANLEKPREEYCGQLSLLTRSGIPCQEKINFNEGVMLSEVVDLSCITSG